VTVIVTVTVIVKEIKMKTKIRWVIAHEPIGLFLKVADRFAKQVNKKTGGKFDIEVLSLSDYAKKYNDGKKVTKYHLMDMINSGQIEMSHIYTTWLGDYNKDLHALDLPFLFKDHAHADRVLEGDIGTELLAGVSKNSNIKAMSFTYSGGYRIVPANFKADTVDAWEGKVVRTSRSPVAVDTFKLLGAVPREDIALEDMNEAADRGEIAAGESTYVRVFPLEHNKSFEYVNDTAHSLFLTSIIINQDFFQTLDKRTQEVFAIAAADAARTERRESVEDIPNILAQCEAEKVEVVKMNREETAKFMFITTRIYDMYKDYFTPGLVPALLKA
jgi:TRAP-type C4-dicarboxylate transport system substrate-binding protein